MRILYVCTANICRSPSAEALLRDSAVPGVEVRSAGTSAVAGAPGCTVAPALEGRNQEHTSQPLTGDQVEWADLILTAAREHRAAVVALDPAARTRTFTIRQAGRLAQWLLDAGMVAAAVDRAADPQGWHERFDEGDPRRLVAPLPGPGDAEWLVGELDAARGVVSTPAPAIPPPGRWRRRKGEDDPQHPDDVPDPHVLGFEWHDPAYQQLQESTAALAALLRELVA